MWHALAAVKLCAAALLAAALLVACSSSEPSPAPPQLSEALAQANYVGQSVCVACHQRENRHWSHTVHARAFQSSGLPPVAERGCESCHGPGSLHLTAPTDKSLIVAFTRASQSTVGQQNGMCLQCHSGQERIFWQGSAHETRDLACSDCHNPMAEVSSSGLLREQTISDTCFSCHQEQRSEFRKRSHMPLLEGKVACTDCHNPHGSSTRPLLTDISVNQLCFQCHQEKRGPFLWEHAPVRESCLNCHLAHGSNHEALLVTARPFLCQQCHSNRGHPNDLLTPVNLPGGLSPDARLMNRSCQNCHVQIHGSNHPSGARFHR